MDDQTYALAANVGLESRNATAHRVAVAAMHRLPAMAVWCFIEARPVVQTMVLLRFTAAVLLSLGLTWPGLQVLSGCGAMVLTSTCVYLVNGITDLAGDVANGSGRPLARGRLTQVQARTAAWLLGTGGGLLALQAGSGVAVCVAAMLIAGLGYSIGNQPWKNRPRAASASIGVLGASTYLAGSLSTGRQFCLPVLLLGTAMTLWMSLVGARVKDFSDVTGDLIAGRSTQAAGSSEPRLRRKAAVSALAVATAFLLLASWYARQLVWSAAALLLLAAVVALLALVGRSVGSRAQTRRPYRAFMVGQYLANILAIAGASG